MDTIDILLAIIAIISFVIHIITFFRHEIQKSNEKNKLEVIKEQMRMLYQNIGSLYSSVDFLVQIPKVHKSITVENLQDNARLVRHQIFPLLNMLNNYRKDIDKWKYGQMIESQSLDDSIIEQNIKDADNNVKKNMQKENK